jgi:hypothetical protein
MWWPAVENTAYAGSTPAGVALIGGFKRPQRFGRGHTLFFAFFIHIQAPGFYLAHFYHLGEYGKFKIKYGKGWGVLTMFVTGSNPAQVTK